MESNDIAEKIRDAVEDEQQEIHAERAEMAAERERHAAGDRLRSRAALVISALAALLAMVAMRGDEMQVELVHANIQVNDLWAFYQARNIRQTDTAIAVKQVDRDVAERGAAFTPETRALFAAQRADFEQQIKDFESRYDPAYPGDKMRGTGMAEIMYQARHWEHERGVLQRRLPNYHWAEALLQIGIVLGSTAIVVRSPRILVLTIAVGALGMLLGLNGGVLVLSLPGAGAH